MMLQFVMVATFAMIASTPLVDPDWSARLAQVAGIGTRVTWAAVTAPMVRARDMLSVVPADTATTFGVQVGLLATGARVQASQGAGKWHLWDVAGRKMVKCPETLPKVVDVLHGRTGQWAAVDGSGVTGTCKLAQIRFGTPAVTPGGEPNVELILTLPFDRLLVVDGGKG